MKIESALAVSLAAVAFMAFALGLRRSVPLSKMPEMPRKVVGACLMALCLAWALFAWRGAPAVLRTVVFIAIALLLAFGGAITVFSAAIRLSDMPSGKACEAFGPREGRGRVAIVCHPGFSGFAWKAARRLGRMLEERGWSAILYPANIDMPRENRDFRVVIYCSSILFGEPRPPLWACVEKNRGRALPIFGLFTGGVESAKEAEARAFASFVDLRGQCIKGTRKIISFEAASKIENELADYANEISCFLSGGRP